MCEQLVKIWKKTNKKHARDFSALSIDYMKAKKKLRSVLLV